MSLSKQFVKGFKFAVACHNNGSIKKQAEVIGIDSTFNDFNDGFSDCVNKIAKREAIMGDKVGNISIAFKN